MNMRDYVEKMKIINQSLLDFIDQVDDSEEQFQNLICNIEKHNIADNHNDLKIFLYILASISANHHISPHFYDKIEKIIIMYEDDINKNFTNYEICKIFQKSKKILLFLFTKSMIKFDFDIVKLLPKDYITFINPEISIKIGIIKKIEENFEEKRQIGENDDIISQLIRQDNIDEFITYVKKNDYSLNSEIKYSIYETNHFLIKRKNVKLIEYAAFFGSVQICTYLFKNDVELNSNLWFFAIHSDNAEMINFLEENKVKKSCNKLIKESIKCHHNDIVNYIDKNYLDGKIESFDDINFNENYKDNVISFCFHYYNFMYMPYEINNKTILYYACHYDYLEIVKFLLKTQNIDINEELISKFIIFLNVILNSHK